MSLYPPEIMREELVELIGEGTTVWALIVCTVVILQAIERQSQ